ncbi:PE family protein PE27A, partial [Mycobacterium tuberculosis TKK_03_0058]
AVEALTARLAAAH